MIIFWIKNIKRYQHSALIGTLIFSLSLRAMEPQNRRATEMVIEVCQTNEAAQQPQTTLKDQTITMTKTTKATLLLSILELKKSCARFAQLNKTAQEMSDKDLADIAKLKQQEKLREWEKIRERKRKEFEQLIHTKRAERKSCRHAKVS